MAILFASTTVGACIGNNLNPRAFHAAGTFTTSGHGWVIATMGDNLIHYTVYSGNGGRPTVDRIMSLAEAQYYTALFHAQGHGEGGDC